MSDPKEPSEQQPNSEEILGQMFFALGAGAGQHWLKCEAAGYIHEVFLRFIDGGLKNKNADWKRDAPWVLHYMETFGRFAAARSLSEGRHSINLIDVRETLAKIVYLEEGTNQGDWCSGND